MTYYLMAKLPTRNLLLSQEYETDERPREVIRVINEDPLLRGTLVLLKAVTDD